jgi:hypothetical protein
MVSLSRLPTLTSRDKLPSVAAFIADVKLPIGAGVLERQKELRHCSKG